MTKNTITLLILLFIFNETVSAQDYSVNSIMTKKYNPTTNLIVWPEEFNPEKAKW
jgi:hypothetical protein